LEKQSEYFIIIGGKMRIFTYGFSEENMEIVRKYFGEADYIDVTPQYQDILALCADIVLMNVDYARAEIVNIIKQFEMETIGEDDTKYYYITDKTIEMWEEEFSNRRE